MTIACESEPMVHTASIFHVVPFTRPMTVIGFKGPDFASKTVLLRQAKTAGEDASVHAALRPLTDRRPLSVEDLLTEQLSPIGHRSVRPRLYRAAVVCHPKATSE